MTSLQNNDWINALLATGPLEIKELCEQDPQTRKICEDKTFWIAKIERDFPKVSQDELKTVTDPFATYFVLYRRLLNSKVDSLLTTRGKELGHFTSLLEELEDEEAWLKQKKVYLKKKIENINKRYDMQLDSLEEELKKLCE